MATNIPRFVIESQIIEKTLCHLTQREYICDD